MEAPSVEQLAEWPVQQAYGDLTGRRLARDPGRKALAQEREADRGLGVQLASAMCVGTLVPHPHAGDPGYKLRIGVHVAH